MEKNMKYLAQEIKELTLGTPPWHRGEYKVKKGFFKDRHIITVETAGGCDRDYDVDPNTLHKSTGLRDANDALIYEGDILSYKDGFVIAAWSENAGMWALQFFPGEGVGNIPLYQYLQEERMEVVSNIYIDPDFYNDIGIEIFKRDPQKYKDVFVGKIIKESECYDGIQYIYVTDVKYTSASIHDNSNTAGNYEFIGVGLYKFKEDDGFYIDREYHTFKFSTDAAKLKILGESLVDFIQNYKTVKPDVQIPIYNNYR